MKPEKKGTLNFSLRKDFSNKKTDRQRKVECPPFFNDDKNEPIVVARVVPTARSRMRAVVILAVVVVALVVIYGWNPTGAEDKFVPKCPTFILTGFYCPGCGTLRALHQLLHGHPLAALDYNPMAVLLLPVIGYGALVSFVRGVWDYRLPCPRIRARTAWLLLAVILLFGVLRNLPWYPLTLLAP